MHLLFLDESGRISDKSLFALGGMVRPRRSAPLDDDPVDFDVIVARGSA